MVARVRRGLVDARKRQGHTLESLAHALTVEPSTVRRWERGTSDPLPLTWPRLAHELDITTDELVGFLAKPCCEKCGKVLAADNTENLCGVCRRDRQSQLDEPPQVGDEFFDTAELKAAFASWHIGRVFRAYRAHPYFLGIFSRPLTQENLGRWLGLNQNHMSKLETGKAEQNLELLQEWAAILHLPQPMLWFDLPGQSRLQSSDVRPAFAVGDLVVTTAGESIDFLTWLESGNVGEFTIEQIHGDIRQAARSYLKVPTQPLFEHVRRLRDRTFSLLNGHQKLAQTRDLYSAAGWSLAMLAWMSIDLGNSEAAESHLRAAWVCAENAEQNNLRAWVRATQHTAAYWQGDYGRAASYAEDGLSYSRGGSVELFLSSAVALDLAQSGNATRARQFLNQARETASNSTGQLVDELPGPFSCTVDRASGGFWSETYFALNEPGKTLELANNAVTSFEATPLDRRNLGSERMVRCQQAKAHILVGELDGARDSLSTVLDTAPEHRMKPLVQRLSEIGKMVQSGRHHAALEASEITDSIIEFRGTLTTPTEESLS